MSDSFIVRQPIFGTSGSLIGYEVLYSNSEDGRQALIQSILSGTFDLVRGPQPAFVACGREQLVENALHMIDPKTAILLLPPDLEADDEVVHALTQYRANGGQVALDQLVGGASPSEALLPYATWCRFDARLDDVSDVLPASARVRAAQPNIRLIANYVTTTEHHYLALQARVDAFQGQFFSSPEPVPATELPQSSVAALRLIGLARDSNVSDRKLEDVLETDPVLTFQLLRLVNSAAVGMRGVSSIGQSLRLIGRAAFQRWLAVAVAASRKSQTGVDQELVRQAVERGRLMEQLGGKTRDPGTLFLVGLFSLLDSVFRMTLPEILERVALSDEATEALLDRMGPYADALSFAESYELGMFESAGELAKDMGIDPATIGDLYTNAVSWTNEALSALSAPVPATPASARR